MPVRAHSLRALAFGSLLALPLVATADRAPERTNTSAAIEEAKERPAEPLAVFPQNRHFGWADADFSPYDSRPLPLALAAARRRNAEPVPFDLTYLTADHATGNGPSAIIAVRPCVVFDRPGGNRLARAALLAPGTIETVKDFFGLRAMEWPEFGALDMILTRVRMNITPGAEPGHGSFQAHTTCAVLRTRERYDWKAAMDRMPSTVRHTHRSREYRTLSVDARRLQPNWAHGPVNVALFVPNDRTLVVDTESAIEALIDRLADGKSAAEPAGWTKVNHGVGAVALANSDKTWALFLPGSAGPRLEKGGDWEWNVIDDMDELVIGLDDRPTTRFRLIATARDPFSGKRMAWNAKRLLALAETHLAEEDEEQPARDVVRELWKKGRFALTFRGFEITADAGTDLLCPLLDRLTPPAPLVDPARGLFRGSSTPGGF